MERLRNSEIDRETKRERENERKRRRKNEIDRVVDRGCRDIDVRTDFY